MLIKSCLFSVRRSTVVQKVVSSSFGFFTWKVLYCLCENFLHSIYFFRPGSISGSRSSYGSCSGSAKAKSAVPAVPASQYCFADMLQMCKDDSIRFYFQTSSLVKAVCNPVTSFFVFTDFRIGSGTEIGSESVYFLKLNRWIWWRRWDNSSSCGEIFLEKACIWIDFRWA